MFKPKFSIHLKPDGDALACLGSQLVDIVDILKTQLEPHVWYASDVDAFNRLPGELGLDTWLLRKVGDDSTLTDFSSKIDQFIWGVFIAIRSPDCEIQQIELTQLTTEDEPYRPINLEGVLIEIRAFDTSYFEVISDNESLIDKLADRFKTEVLS